MTDAFTVEWIDDGFLYPSATLAHDTVTPDGFVIVPVAGLPEPVQFFRVIVNGETHLLLMEAAARSRSLVQAAIWERYGIERPVLQP